MKRPVGRLSYRAVVKHKSFLLRAASRGIPRRVVARAELHLGELFPRVGFIVINLELPTRAVVLFYKWNFRFTSGSRAKKEQVALIVYEGASIRRERCYYDFGASQMPLNP